METSHWYSGMRMKVDEEAAISLPLALASLGRTYGTKDVVILEVTTQPRKRPNKETSDNKSSYWYVARCKINGVLIKLLWNWNQHRWVRVF